MSTPVRRMISSVSRQTIARLKTSPVCALVTTTLRGRTLRKSTVMLRPPGQDTTLGGAPATWTDTEGPSMFAT